MIVNLIIGLVTTVVGWIDGLLPHITMPSWLVGGGLVPTAVSNLIGEAFYSISSWFPVQVLTEIVVGVCNFWPVVAAYTVAQWVYNHIPTIAGFNVGNG